MDNPFLFIDQRLGRIERLMEQIIASGTSPVPTIVEQDNDDTLKSAEEIAIHLDKSIQTVWRLAKNGVLPFYKPGRSYLFRLSEVNKAISSQTPIKRKGKGGNNGS